MALEFHFSVTPVGSDGNPQGEPFRLVARSRVLGQWEREFRGRKLAQLDNIGVNDIEEIAWVAAKRDKGYTENLAQFRDQHEIDILSPQDLARDKARERAKQDAENQGQEWTEEDAEEFDLQFDREWEHGVQDEQRGVGPTRLGRSAAR